ncbi:probable E3 ubiquitin-protein ligase HECTD4 isoform X2 [Antedon mediterranea]|uniref:probable E3 ubiquitin-protein ligase HECTD4 isoform X2 n=1 Tax=Antedon mediterranea TaxID=105859 RepID=UPI003AF97F10
MATSSSVNDNTQWLSISEETLFLHNGLLRILDLVELPQQATDNSDSQGTEANENDVVSFDSKDPKELTERLLAVCGTNNNVFAYSRLLDYRRNALKGLWNAQRQLAATSEKAVEKEAASQEETFNLLRKQGLWQQGDTVSFSSRVSLLLVFPLLKSQSVVDPALIGTTTKLLLNCLQDCPPLSLTKEPTDCLNGLENLLCTWLGEHSEVESLRTITDIEQKESAAAALTALACARGSIKTLIHTVHLLQKLSNEIKSLPVAKILYKLLQLAGGPGCPSSLLGTKHILCWGFEDMLSITERGSDQDKDKENEFGRSVGSDGNFLYVTGSCGRGIAKIGTGLHGTLRGYVYTTNLEVDSGWVAYGDGYLVHRPTSFDGKSGILFTMVDMNTLKMKEVVTFEQTCEIALTVSLCSDGLYFYWIWCPASVVDKNGKGQNVYLEVFKIQKSEEKYQAIHVQQPVILQRKDEGTKTDTNTLMARLRNYRSTTMALVAGSPVQNAAKDDLSNTSCGLALKVLRKSPVYVCGTNVVIITSPVGGSSASSRFGPGSTLSSSRALCTNHIFSVSNGNFNVRVDCTDAPACAMARGSSVQSIGVCYDVVNDMIWTCSNDWIDQWYNPGLRAPHHVHRQLGVEPLPQLQPPTDSLPISDVISQLLLHIGSTCCHKAHSDLLMTSLGRILLGQQVVDMPFLIRVYQILKIALDTGNMQTAQCMLMVSQVVIKSSMFKRKTEVEIQLLKNNREALWYILTANDDRITEGAQREACLVLSAGLTVLYPTQQEQTSLIHQLLSCSDTTPALSKLSDVLLVNLSQQLRQEWNDKEQPVKLSDELVNYILRITVKESCILLKNCLTLPDDEFQVFLAGTPHASPCLQYIMGILTYQTRNLILSSTESEAAVEDQENGNSSLEPESSFLGLASSILKGSEKVLEVLLDVVGNLVNEEGKTSTSRIEGLERVLKGTVLGHLLPLITTSLTHPKLCCLSVVKQLMPQLVQLVLLSSKVALCLKKYIGNSDDCSGKLYTSSTSESKSGFLGGFKIPAPWSSGKVVETIHPVRDNYKFRETIHIPGARCLYLRFEPRCASQYDYDKVVIYAGPTSSSRKVAEYGGNTYGYGSRSVLGSGWPKDLVKVEGSTVTFTFEMRSGREHNTPDKALWGFSCMVRAHESSELPSNHLPFIVDIALGLAVLTCTHLHVLYDGPKETKHEKQCQHILNSKILRRCVWQTSSTGAKAFKIPAPVARIQLSKDVLQRLKKLSGKTEPTLRPSAKEVIQPEVLQEVILSAVIKHLNLQHQVHSHSEEDGERMKLINTVQEIYKRIYALERQLQAMCELEQKWRNDVEEMKNLESATENYTPFFADYHHQETKLYELEMLCYIIDVPLDIINQEKSVKVLREKLEKEVKISDIRPKLSRVKALVAGIIERAELLLLVTIATRKCPPEGILRSVSDSNGQQVLARSVSKDSSKKSSVSSAYSRSVSVPSGLRQKTQSRYHKRLEREGSVSLLQDSVLKEDQEGLPAYLTFLDDILTFIGTNPECTVSCQTFLAAAKVRQERAESRKQALGHIRELLNAACRIGEGTHLIVAVTLVLQHGPKIRELYCGGMVEDIRQAFLETMTSVVKLAAMQPLACGNSIALLCTIPYTRNEEQCLVDSGLVQLLDQLCSLGTADTGGSAMQGNRLHVSTLAWAGFQVLANRCVSWESTEDLPHDFGHTGLARHVSALLTNHLARATDNKGNEAAGSEALQEVLSLLNDLSRSRMGRSILSQPACVSKLLSLLLDQRPSPKLVLIILQLCRVALPLMNADDCEKVELPPWGQDVTSFGGQDEALSDPPAKIASLLLAKLGDYIVPGCQTTAIVEPCASTPGSASSSSKVLSCDEDNADMYEGQLSIFVHKRADQTSHEVIQPLISADGRPFRLGSGPNMERVVRMDQELNRNGKTEVLTDEARVAMRRAARWAQCGLVLSSCPPVENTATDAGREKKKVNSESVCKERNTELARTDPVRPFISGHVANSMAAEVIALLHGLLTAPESAAAQIWASAVERVLSHSLSLVSTLTTALSTHIDLLTSHPQGEMIESLMSVCRQVVAAFCALGGFKDSIKVGSQVEVIGDGASSITGQVISISEQQGIATVNFDTADKDGIPRYNDTLEVPLSRLQTPHAQVLSLDQLSMTEKVVSALHALLLPGGQGALSPLEIPLPTVGDGSSITMATCRVLAEIKTRASIVLATNMKNTAFAAEFVKPSSAPLEILRSLSSQCPAGDRLPVLASQCERLRMLYRDCARPPPPPSKSTTRPMKVMTFDPTRTFPPVCGCLLSQDFTELSFLSDLLYSTNYPRGTFVYASQPIPSMAPSFYWELKLSLFGDSGEEPGPCISFGFAPEADRRRSGAWTNPVGTVLFHNNGRAVHYNGSSLLQWRSVRLDITLKGGDVAGIGWEKDKTSVRGSEKGRVFFTYNGRRLATSLEDVAAGLYPVVHIQKKNTRIRANFGSHAFAYAEGLQHYKAAEGCSDSMEEISANFRVLPFHTEEESDNEGTTPTNLTAEPIGDSKATPLAVVAAKPCKIVESPSQPQEYDTDTANLYELRKSYDNFTSTGPDIRLLMANQEDDSEDDDSDDNLHEDHHALLVKAWESKVFPVIRRRFRNEAERRSGLEQIKGALQLGMTDIARQTVEFLYEENGGMPRELHLPTMEDIKAEAAKFSIDKVRKGTSVVICQPENLVSSGGTVVPKFAVRGMLKTFGLTGAVLDVDTQNELVQVETYLRSEGVLVCFWYPIELLQRPRAGYRRSDSSECMTFDISNIVIHKELVNFESGLAKMYLRSALINLLRQADNTHVVEALSFPLTSSQAAANQTQDNAQLKLLSNQLLAPPQSDGTLQLTSLLTTKSPKQSLSSSLLRFSDIFYEEADVLRNELKVAIATALQQGGESHLMELVSEFCGFLQIAPKNFLCEEVIVNENKMNTDVKFPGTCCIVVSCRQDSKTTKKEISLYQAPWAKICYYGQGHKIKKSGHTAPREVICYPANASANTGGGLTGPPTYELQPYPSGIIPSDCVYAKIGVSPSPGYVVTMHGLPPSFPLAMAFIETLITCCADLTLVFPETVLPTSTIGDNDCDNISRQDLPLGSNVPLYLLELLANYIWTTSSPPSIKEYIFHMMAQLLRLARKKEAGQPMMPSLSLMLRLQQLKFQLHDLEIIESSGDFCRHSTYFFSLMEISLAVSELGSSVGSPTPVSPSTSLMSPFGLPSSHSSARRKKTKSKKGSIPRRSSEAEVDSARRKKSDEHLWFQRATASSLLLRCLLKEFQSEDSTLEEALLEAHQKISCPSCHSRLLIISGIPVCLDELTVRNSITEIANVNGGLFNDELWIPTQKPLLMKEIVVDEKTKVLEQQSGDDPTAQVDVQSVLAELLAGMDLWQEQQLAAISQGQQDATSGGGGATGDNVNEAENLLSPRIKGYAVLQVRSNANIEHMEASLVNIKAMSQIDGGLVSGEDILSISPVNSTLLTQGATEMNILLEYLTAKLQMSDNCLNCQAVETLSEIFVTTVTASESSKTKEQGRSVGSPDAILTLTKEQILQQMPGNLLHDFLSASKAPKKSYTEQVSHVLRHYGIPNPSKPKKTLPKSSKDPGKGVGKKSTKSAKEKLFVAEVTSPKSKTGEKKVKKVEKGTKETSELKVKDVHEEKVLTNEGFLQFVSDKIKEDVTAVWRGIMACGYSLQYEKLFIPDSSSALSAMKNWKNEKDLALVSFVNSLCRKLAVTPSRLHPHEIYISEAELAYSDYKPLQGTSTEALILRFALLQNLNNQIESSLLPFVDLRPAKTFNLSSAAVLEQSRGLLFYDTKDKLFNVILDSTAQRSVDHAAPEITLDPLEVLGADTTGCLSTQFCQAARQLSTVPSSKLCVKIASGGDPTYAFNVRLTGEEVHGNSGSFRHFLDQVTKELLSPSLGLLMPCPSSSVGKNVGKYMLRPGLLTYPEEKLLQFLGQFLGIALRADIPLALDFMACFWKGLIGLQIDMESDFKEVDVVTNKFLQDLEKAANEKDFLSLLTKFSLEENQEMESDEDEQSRYCHKFTHTTLMGVEVELIEGGSDINLSWENRLDFIKAVKQLRMDEIVSCERMQAVRCGLASIIPIQLLSLMTVRDIELRMCGLPTVDLDFLKAHTMYQVGLVETNPHIQFFWQTLESFSQENLCRFVKFACNQQRIPCTCPCKDGNADTTHVPPYPMKIAPPDGSSGSPDSRFIRVETCMFMVKLPQYSSLDVMKKRLLYAINCRDDPLSG